jgi:3-oxoadipate enol-lactonase
MHKQHIGGLDLAYKDQGEGEETVILLHGFSGSSEYWQEVAPLLDSCRVITVDLRGHGQSDLSDSAFTIEDMAKDIHYFMDQKQLENIYLFGHSLGGYITLAFAELFKEKLKGYGLIHSSALADSEEAKVNRLSSIEKIKKEGMHSFVDDLVPNLFNPARQEELKEKIQAAKEIGYETSPIGAIQTLKAMRDRADRSDVVKNSNLPILLLAGEHDGVIPKEKVFIHKAPHIQTEVLPESGHMGIFEEPEKLAYTIKEFINHQK